MKDNSKINKDFEHFPYKGYVLKSPKHEPTEIYSYLSRQIDKRMVRSGAFNLHIEHVRTGIKGMQEILISHVFDMDEIKSKGIIADKHLSQVCSTYKSISESVIINESSTKGIESERVHKSININKEKGAIDETEDG